MATLFEEPEERLADLGGGEGCGHGVGYDTASSDFNRMNRRGTGAVQGYARCRRMRPTLALIALLLSPLAAAQGDARIVFLTRQLTTAKDPRARAQTALVLGASKDPAAVGPLCGALKDPEAFVRSAAARALGDLKDPSAGACLKAARADSDADVQQAVARAIEALTAPVAPTGPTAGTLYVAIEPIIDKTGGLPPDTLKLTEDLLRSKLAKLGASFAPSGEDRAAATSLIRSRKLKGWMLRLQVVPHANNGLKISLLCMTYPEQAIKGDYSVKASGAKQPDLLKLMVPKVVDDAADDLEWSKR